ncbi:response regulator [Hoeflea poritis]|uniref:Response regulator n=1 Tax=Hoeflea poritis TaxID=2993659 RepID=A0ABT4VT39_9HYPH|nr:response regulator [Hoeflea poritis]MDA4847877.1 response regulator [Hoeflea poritis]
MQRLILVDKSVIIRKVAKRILSDLGFLVSEADDAQTALSICKGRVPAVMIVDACLPGATDLIGEVRELPGGDKVKIYYCLIEGKFKHMMQGKRAGADDFLLKPFDREILTKVFSDQSKTAA